MAKVALEVELDARKLAELLKKLPPEEREEFAALIVSDPELADVREEIEDSLLIVKTEGEPSRPYEEFAEELRREGRL